MTGFKSRNALVLGSTFVMTLGVACGKKKVGGSSNDEAGSQGGKVNSVDGQVTGGTLTLQLADTLELLPAKKDGAALALAGTEMDEAKANVSYHVEERSTDAIRQVQSIFCFLAQTHYTEMANKGAYVALVDEKRCDKESGNDSSGNSGSARAQSYRRTTILSTREEGKALEAKLWLEPTDQDPKGIHVQLKVAEGASAENPVGIFRMNFGMAADGGQGAGKGGGGYIETARNDDGTIQLKIVSDFSGAEYSDSLKAAVRLEVAGGEVKSGKMRTENASKWQDGSRSSSFSVAFDDNFLNRAGSETGENGQTNKADACLDRNSFAQSANRYSLFDGAGKLLKLKSGFPIEFKNAKGQTVNGQASYWGVWAPEGEFDGVTKVDRVEFMNGTRSTTPHTVVRAPGKLSKMTAETIKLSELKGVEMSRWTSDGETLVTWDGTQFVNLAKRVRDNQGSEQRTPLSGTVAAEYGGWRFHVESLSADIFVPEGQASNEFKVRFFKRSYVSGTANVPSGKLVCFDRCIKMNGTVEEFKTQSFGGQASGPFVQTTGWGDKPSNTAMNIATPVATYTWDASKHNLVMGGTQFALPSGMPTASPNDANSNIYQSTGALVPEAAWSALANKETMTAWDIENKVDEYYTFETGNSSWSQYIALVDGAGKVVTFDQPLVYTYVHSEANDLNGQAGKDYFGQIFSLNYGGPGEFWGIPMAKKQGMDWPMPVFSLAVGAKITDDGVLAVPMDVTQQLNEVDAAKCSALSLDQVPDAPSETPAGADNGDLPSGELPVAYVGGEAA